MKKASTEFYEMIKFLNIPPTVFTNQTWIYEEEYAEFVEKIKTMYPNILKDIELSKLTQDEKLNIIIKNQEELKQLINLILTKL